MHDIYEELVQNLVHDVGLGIDASSTHTHTMCRTYNSHLQSPEPSHHCFRCGAALRYTSVWKWSGGEVVVRMK